MHFYIFTALLGEKCFSKISLENHYVGFKPNGAIFTWVNRILGWEALGVVAKTSAAMLVPSQVGTVSS